MKLSLGFSPCPNDTYIFDAMVHGKIDTEGLAFDMVLGDVEMLNQKAFAGELAITKLSYHAVAYLTHTYRLLDAGSALGNNCGPLLIAKNANSREAIATGTIAIPGKYTTANFLLSYAFPEVQHKVEMVFSDIEDAVLAGDVNAGLIIHENRFTYAQKGLVKLLDLGEHWESTTGMPIPLGGIAIRRDLPLDVQHKVNRVLQRSVQFAFDHPSSALPFVRAHAQEMDEAVMYQHIALYVNDYTLHLGQRGRAAVQHLFDVVARQQIVPPRQQALFLPD
ncbi:MAG TPA: 1,4-dihydroxy-6-naphthoate synthase [Saprospiraceae bacterium]|nr:1,4-dihydroxy-6-naphthoate synthase [Saprospiraceae bacterium]HMP12787.1 1,4-dihydroxy-6-naphthoate synthase [Saprospiraceae bacterium]